MYKYLNKKLETPYHAGACSYLLFFRELDDILRVFFPAMDARNPENKSDLFKRLVSARKGTNKHINQ